LWAFFGLLILSTSLALWKGEMPERLGGLVILEMTVLQFVSTAFEPRTYFEVDLASVVVDLLGLSGFAAIAIHARRVWPLWAAALQLLSLMSHAVRETDRDAGALVYVAMKSGPTFMVLVALLMGTTVQILRRRRGQADSPWKDW
jgi:hypothetical protein